jgi:hypothetical protein
MPRYFFHLNGIVDLDGQTFATVEDVCREAQSVARKLAENGTSQSDERVVVTDERGRLVHEEPLAMHHSALCSAPDAGRNTQFMPTYFFDLQTSSEKICDHLGTELMDAAAAKVHAQSVAQELMRNREDATRSWRIDIRDGYARRCGHVVFASVDASLGHLAPELRKSLQEFYETSASLRETVGATRQSLRQIKATLARAEEMLHIASVDGAAVVD